MGKKEPIFGIVVAGLFLWPFWAIAMIPLSMGYYVTEALEALMIDVKKK